MSYTTVEAALVTVIQLHSDYDSGNCSAGDYRILGAGSAQSIVVTPGPFSRSITAAPRRMGTSWTINIEIFIPFRSEMSDIKSELRLFRQTLIDQVDKYPRLNDASGVIDAMIDSGGEPELWQGENKRWWIQKLRCTVKERVTVIIAE